MKTRLFALLAGLLLPALAFAGPITLFSGVDNANVSIAAPSGTLFAGGVGGTPLDGTNVYTFDLANPSVITVNIDDVGFVGDVYEAVWNGTFVGQTTQVPLNGPSLSTGSFTFLAPAGTNTLGIADDLFQYIGTPDPWGGGTVPSDFSPAGFEIKVLATPTPEPASLALLGLGLLTLGGFALRRRPAFTAPRA